MIAAGESSRRRPPSSGGQARVGGSNAHPIGVAVMQVPFFAIAHGLTRWTNLSADGFTLYYQHAAGIAGLFWTIAGLWLLGGLLAVTFQPASRPRRW